MRNVFVEAEDGSAVLADRFTPSLPVELGEPLRAAARELADQGWLDSGDTWRAFPGRRGRYSIWIEDKTGERHNFVLFVSQLEDRTAERLSPPPRKRRLVVSLQGGHGQGSWQELVPAQEYIERRFAGPLRRQLLSVLERALRGERTSDGLIEPVAHGVVIRAPSTEPQVRAYDAELRLEWQRDP